MGKAYAEWLEMLGGAFNQFEIDSKLGAAGKRKVLETLQSIAPGRS